MEPLIFSPHNPLLSVLLLSLNLSLSLPFSLSLSNYLEYTTSSAFASLSFYDIIRICLALLHTTILVYVRRLSANRQQSVWLQRVQHL